MIQNKVVLVLGGVHLGLAFENDLDHPLYLPVFSPAFTQRAQKANPKNELLLRALPAYSKGESLRIVDATAGLGRDAFLFVSKGHSVVMCERSPLLAALLKEALTVSDRVSLHEGDAVLFLSSLEDAPDVVYLDPMFPARTKSAMVKKEMQILQALLKNEPENADALLHAACRTAKKRVIVKRPRNAPPLAEKAPDFSYAGKHMRFDVYTRKYT